MKSVSFSVYALKSHIRLTTILPYCSKDHSNQKGPPNKRKVAVEVFFCQCLLSLPHGELWGPVGTDRGIFK